MKPVKLQFKGINSFSEQTEIDFEKLTKSGIFGIFGDTGSGKSTILDCINFALYGKVERSKEKLDIINYRCDAAEVKFEFDVINEGKRKRYIAERVLKKKSGLHKAALYEDGVCVADNATTVNKKVTAVLGIDAEDFRKCIALPQGEFSQFVKSQPSERIALIERLFSLYKYGDRLKERLKARESAAETEYQKINAQLVLFADVSAEILKNLENSIGEEKKRLEELIKADAEAEKRCAEVKSLAEKFNELNDIKNKLAALTARKPQMEELRAGLKIAPACKSVAETDAEISEKKSAFEKTERDILKINSELDGEVEKLKKLKLRLTESRFDDKIADCLTLAAKYESCAGKPEKLNGLAKALDGKRNEYKDKGAELSKYEKICADAERNLADVKKKLEECGAADLDNLINVYFRGAVLKEEYVCELDYFVGLNGQIKFHKDNSELYKFMESELKQRIDLYKDRVCQVKDFNIAEARKRLENFRSASEEKEKLAAELNVKAMALKDAQAAAENCRREREIIRRDGDELRKQKDELQEQLKEVFGGETDYVAAEERTAAELKNLRSQKERLNSETEQCAELITRLTAQAAALKSKADNYKADISRLCDKLKALISQSGLDGLESCKKVAGEYAKYADADKALSEFDTQLLSYGERLEKLRAVRGIDEYNEQTLNDAVVEKKNAAADLAAAREKLAVMQSNYTSGLKRAEDKKILEKQLAAVEKQRNLIAQLKDLTKGNKFMEFIANEYLYDISALASSTLLNLTDGRYFLTYEDNFYAGDNFNCGDLRGVNTLSGGETFLVSLSLALALSQTICASLKSIEFFFLDEGFGTLDGTLVDTVLNALEKLKGEHFTIGVISHVEELKHRIDNKITVNKATESRGSSVSVSC